MSTALTTLSAKLAQRFGIGDGALDVLKATAFKGPATDDQMTALLIVATQYGLNPWTKEIYAFPDSRNGIVPVVGVDGWSRIINEQPAFDGVEFEQNEDECTCIMYRKDRKHPTRITEYMSECKRDSVAPWKSHPRRMLRHKALIQCARVAFGFGGIYDQDEAERIIESPNGAIDGQSRRVTEAPDVPAASAELLETAFKHADEGKASFSAWWDAVPEADGIALAPHLPELKARYMKAAVKTTEVADATTV